MRLLACLLALSCVGSTCGQLKIEGPTDFKPHQMVRLRCSGASPKGALLWRVYPPETVDRATSPRGLLEFVAHPGEYRIELLLIDIVDGNTVVEEAFHSIRITACEGHRPVPPAPVPPAPPPDKGTVDAVKALGRITFGNSGCTATVIGPRRQDGRWDILTAAHCVRGVGQRGVFLHKDGRRIPISVVVLNRMSDICWCVTDQAYDDLSYAIIAKDNPAPGTAVWHMGYGVDRPGNREEGTITAGEDRDGQLRMVLNVSSGDSGGGIFRADNNELISCVCCTKAPGRRIDVWGGSTRRINELRPSPAQTNNGSTPPGMIQSPDGNRLKDEVDSWIPRPIPVYPK